MTIELAKTYEPAQVQEESSRRWLDANAFAATPDARPPEQRYVIMMPLPNVTGALHMGHAMDNVMQDLLIRWHRMQGKNVLWQPGTDHAGIATQAVVEKRLFELEGKTRHDIGRDALVQRIWEWKDEYQQRIVRQQQLMGCSADWQRQRFTMDEVCSAAVREVFFRMFRDRLIYRGDRLVNWDCQLQTAVADDEVYHEPIQGHFWHLCYPIVNPRTGEPAHVIVATTRPETMLGDTAVACHPDPRQALSTAIAEAKAKLADAPAKDKPGIQAEIDRLEDRQTTHLPTLEKLAVMARDGRKVLLPLLNREIPLVLDEWAKPDLGSGCVKITPAHDPNDYMVWRRFEGRIGIVNILEPTGKLNANAGPYAGLDRLVARDKVVEDLKAAGLLDSVEDREIEIGHSDRSKTPIEPYLSKQWFVRMGDVEGGIVCGKGTPNQFGAKGLAQAAIDAATPGWKTKAGRSLAFHPDRYQSGYVNWLSEKRDWCISRQLWWGHRIPVWAMPCANVAELNTIAGGLPKGEEENLWAWLADADGRHWTLAEAAQVDFGKPGSREVQVCLRNRTQEKRLAPQLEALGFKQDPDVLDTWFSSALWPFSTLGWPDPETAPINPGQTSLGKTVTGPDSFNYYYPGSCLVTARDIITLWVARMLVMGLYNHGDVPFTDCFVHAKILDGNGVTMSKSKGNGIDPVDIIETYGADAMRYLICDMETGMQDVRLPVQATCPTCSQKVELTDAKHGRTIFTYLCQHCHAEFDVLGTMADVPAAKVTSDRFEVGRAFCNKLWNAARFAMMNLDSLGYRPLTQSDLSPEDRWILSRLSRAIAEVEDRLRDYQPSAALSAARDFFWNELCDWYLELIKPRMKDEAQAPVARQVLALTLDQVLRLLHPFVPFITEALWASLRTQAPVRGIDEPVPDAPLCINAPWPKATEAWKDAPLEAEFGRVKEVIGKLRELRARHDVPPKKTLPAAVRAPASAAAILDKYRQIIQDQARLETLQLGSDVEPPAGAASNVTGDIEVFLGGVLDPDKERGRLESQRQKIVKLIEASERKLGNADFVARAPAQVVATEQQRVAELKGQLFAIEKNLQALV